MVKKFIGMIFVLIISFTFIGCTINDEDISFNSVSNTYLVGNQFALNRSIDNIPVTYVSSDESVIYINDYYGEALACGDVIIYAYIRQTGTLVKEYLVSVISSNPEAIEVSGSSSMSVGDTQNLSVTVSPTGANTEVKWISGDEDIATISSSGEVKAISSGLVTISVYSIYDSTVSDEFTIWVNKTIVSESDEVNNQYTSQTITIDASSLEGVLVPIIEKVKQSVVGVNSYYTKRGTTTLIYSASGVIYKRFCVLENGDELEDDGSVTKFVGYKYYVITCKHLVESMSKVTIYNEDDEEIGADVIAYDSKIDIAVITFETTDYFQVASFGDSDDTETGEFVIAIGNSTGSETYHSSSFGIVSYDYRYVSTDTDSDEVSDWDALYIQHDAAISEGNSGGPLVNLKGEIIGINSVKISSDKIDNMSFAIPSNSVLDLVDQLEDGVVPSRPLLGVTVASVKDILNSETLLAEYPIPNGISYGMYIIEVNSGGVASVAGLKTGDILLSFNGLNIYYSYELRAALNECIIGSGEEIVLTVYRNGEIITLKAVF